ncbi:hypothetical protein FGSG_04830 [Fusarium graminearum PH-1]|uniref:hypothetical protein n=1 Tax=Gibberella zeae (strain ATCC MYA-4620 / CBS 123657 / FGSC 9075 / NRRL 31084 / PH-1) TaxID=229533 RepID=UPI000023D17E|nr:hypothetical protein FGSG_04830 [Fusarium graminearum PH-1]ESU10705.1 hypothetical protein FGSG_04830 [Fusarium graminearum PH-1]|eukprot:XP_011323281.1 hypothetical protein FGSG_04830 [Fusarium graminearum PH-1]
MQEPTERYIRSRIANACDGCKSRKVKCDGKLPCSYCARRQKPHDCHYSPQVRRRRANHQGSVSSLRSPPASELDRALSTGRISTGRNSPATTPVNNETTTHAIDAEEETEVPREARLVCDAQGKLIFVGDCAPLSFFQSVRQLVTTRVGQNAFAPQSSRYSVLENATAHQSLRTPGDNRIPSVHTDDIPLAVSNYLAIATGLVDLFDHRRLQDDLIFWANMGHKTDDATTIVNLLVLAIGTKIDNEERAQEYFEYAREKAYSNLTGNLSVTTVQMFTLITLYMLCSCQINGAFLFFGTAVRAAYSIGIHRTEVNARFGPDIHRQRDRLWKSLRVVDLFLSSSMGRPPATSDVDCTVPYQSPDENLEEHLDLLNASVQIFLVLEGVVTEIYSRRKISLQLTEGISLQLRDWSSRWLKPLKDIVANPDIQDRAQASGACQILATYYYAVMLVSRPFLILMVDPILDLIQRGVLVGHVPILVSWLFASSLVLGIGLLGGFGRVLEKYTRMAIHALDHCSNHDTHAGQYSLIAQSLLATSLEHLEKRELAERQRRTENSSQLFGLIPSDATESPSAFRRETSQPGNVASPLFGDLDSAFLGLSESMMQTPDPSYWTMGNEADTGSALNLFALLDGGGGIDLTHHL